MEKMKKIKKVVASGTEAEGATIGAVLWMFSKVDVYLENGKIKKNVPSGHIKEVNGVYVLEDDVKLNFT